MNCIRECKNCPLWRNQNPIVQDFIGRANAFFVGLSAVKSANAALDQPFSSQTRSGGLLHLVAAEASQHSDIYYTNIVKCLPLDEGKIRYPNSSEKDACAANFALEMEFHSPAKVVLFGKPVSDYVLNKYSLGNSVLADTDGKLNFRLATTENTAFLSAPHPSYVLVYARKQLTEYKSRIVEFLSNGVIRE